MNDAEVALARAAIAAAESKAADAIRECERLRALVTKYEAVLAHYGSSLHEQSNDPANDGKPEATND